MPKRACIITPGGARVCGRVQNTPTVVQACVAAVITAPGAKKRGMTTGRAFAICTASAQKRGVVKPGTRELTRKGERRDAGISRNRRATTERRYEQAVRPAGEASDDKPCKPTKAMRDRVVQSYAIQKYAKRTSSGASFKVQQRLYDRYTAALNALLDKCGWRSMPSWMHDELDAVADTWLNTQAMRGAGKWW